MKKIIKSTHIYLVLLVLLAGYSNFVTNSFTFEPVYSLYPDSAGLYFLHGIVDSSLLHSDLFFKKFNLSPNAVIISLFHSGIGRILGDFLPLILVLKLISILSCVVSTIIIYRIAKNLYSNNYAIFFAWLFLMYFLSMDNFYGGQSRNFGILIFCIFLYYLFKEKFFILGFLSLSMIFFYPSISVVALVICVLIITFFRQKLIQAKTYVLYISWLILIMSLSFILYIHGFFLKLIFKNLSVFQDYKYIQHVGGVLNRFNPADILLYFIFNLNEHSKLYVCFTACVVVCFLVIVILRREKAFWIPKYIWLMLLGAIFSFSFLYPIHPVIASRQFVFTLPLFFVFFLGDNIFKMTKGRINSALFLTVGSLFFLIAHPFLNDVRDYKGYKPIYDYIERLPKDALFAGDPKSQIVTTMPIFSRRSIFFADEIRDLYLLVYDNSEIEKKRKSLIRAVYADSIDTLRNFIAENGIDYFIVESRVYDKSFINNLEMSNDKYDKDTLFIIRKLNNKNDFKLLEFAKQHYDFKLKLKGNDIFLLNSRVIPKE